MRKISLIITILMSVMGFTQDNIYDFKIQSIEGEIVDLKSFEGKKILIVNTASECGYTPQYSELQELHEKYKKELVIIGVPANNFGGQEPGTNESIERFCQVNYGVTFLMAEKQDVAGEGISPLFKWLCNQENEAFNGAIKWNFEKFLINEKGKLEYRYRSGVSPLDETLTSRI